MRPRPTENAMPRLRWFLSGALAMLLALAAGMAAFVGSGRYPIGADRPHLPLTLTLVDALRDRATEAAAKTIVVPRLGDPKQLAEGAAHYDEMCTGCHLAPGRTTSELRAGLYPQPPDLPHDGIDDPAEAFWIIKHGIKLTAMPAWGKTHTDAQIWALVAFVDKLPTITPAQYRALTTRAEGAMPPEHVHDAR